MVLTESTIRELQDRGLELDDLIGRFEKETENAKQQRYAIDSILANATTLDRVPADLLKPGSGNGAARPSVSAMNRADHIRGIVEKMGREVTAGEVAEYLEKTGHKHTGTVSLSHSVNAELNRMAKDDLGIKRVARGKFVYEEKRPASTG